MSTAQSNALNNRRIHIELELRPTLIALGILLAIVVLTIIMVSPSHASHYSWLGDGHRLGR